MPSRQARSPDLPRTLPNAVQRKPKGNSHSQYLRGGVSAELGFLKDIFKQCRLYPGLPNYDIHNFIFICLRGEGAPVIPEQCGS